MGWWRVDADTLATSRFVLSPLTEATAGLMRLRWDSAEIPPDREWLRAHRPAYRARLAADPVTAALVEAALRPHWIADFVAPPPETVERPFEAEIAAVRNVSPEAARRHLADGLNGELPAVLDRDDLGERMAGLLTWIWHTCVEPDWPRRRRIMEADVLARTRLLSLGGWEAALERLRGGMRWLGGGRLQINAYDYPPRDISGAQLLFVPNTLGRGWASWQEPDPARYALTYRCSGILAESGRVVPGALGRLLGQGRARVLVELEQPKSTSQLVAITGMGLGSVGGHLRVLLEAGLVGRRRAGRSVLYARSGAGEAVVRAAAGAL
ncbi:DNA-binding transcriptional ArsR family regulator [Actinoplanes octamycinicus]|uniref:DNA-binding transcriptional ArsR family regulator n=1 Tax=Actinoplanes octamycinicus TaxID=135948 RepID=A0A7W7GWW1_9ACTN|nr:helix-turn-helix domain-containing protein [Actinoplanes octamycinicus]MBB4739796.1 DNA-binding transcriptional ArsR family regulator [Actinoplanes octamycinicus]GIE54978.1 transcriptional regulator [Actinoplanes octamycinicus]